MERADWILRSRSIFTGITPQDVRDGFVAVRGDKIVWVGDGDEYGELLGENTLVTDVGSRTVSCGLVDNHVFFTGYIWQHKGFDASGAENVQQMLSLVRAAAEHTEGTVCGHGADFEDWSEEDLAPGALTAAFPDRPVCVFNDERSRCWMNDAARERYGFDGTECYAEVCCHLLEEFLQDKAEVRRWYEEFQNLLASKGVTAIKEIGFDDYSGFLEELAVMEQQGELKHRSFLVSQPVKAPADMDFAEACRRRFTGDMLRFMGFNIMVDGDAESYEADLLPPWPEGQENAGVDYSALEAVVRAADKRGLRCYMHAEGDAAVRHVLDIYDTCKGNHVITDVELIDPADRRRMAAQKTAAVCYVQIMNCYPEYDGYYGLTRFDEKRQKTVWPYKDMIRDGVLLSFGTDLPLDVPDLGTSLEFACNRRFPDGKPEGGYQKQNALTPGEVLYCWSRNGYAAQHSLEQAGTLTEGKWADLIVLDRDLFSCDPEEYRSVKVIKTVVGGKTVYEENRF